MKSSVVSARISALFFALLGLVYFIGLFVPLMDNDAAHHADIALRIFLSGRYSDLVDHGGDYLDKPHLLFWLSAISFKLFGVNSFAYKFPSFVFTIVGTYSTYRLGKTLYNVETGRLAALIVASAFAYILAITDVRMDAMLTACVAFATWQGAEFVRHKTIANAIGLALGLALGFSTKGTIAVFTPAVGILLYILYLRDWRLFLNWKWLIVVLCFAIFITPVLYAYYLQFNLHPEKVVRGQDHINGVRFILFSQSIERFGGEKFGAAVNNDYLFFFHTFLWAFAPWSGIAIIALIRRLASFTHRDREWMTPGVLVTMLLLLSLSRFKLPHYLNITFPTTAVMCAAFLTNSALNRSWVRVIFTIQVCMCGFILLAATILNAWFFPVDNARTIVGAVLLLALVFHFARSKMYSYMQKAINLSVSTMILTSFLLNSNFYPHLLKYQGGSQLALHTRGMVDPKHVYYWDGIFNSSYIFYTATDLHPLTDSVVKNNRPVWLLTYKNVLSEVRHDGYDLGRIYSVPDYQVSQLTIGFLNPATRAGQLKALVLAEITGKN